MKVSIGPYRNWIGPYQLADKIPFVSEDTREKVGDWLSTTWVNTALHKIDKLKGERKIKVHIDKWDTWNMDDTLSHIILPMLKQLKENKHGSPIVDDEDLPPHMRYSDPKFDPNGWDMGDNWVHYKWEWVLNEMIFAFQNINDHSWEEKFHHGGEPEYETALASADEETGEPLYEMIQKNPNYRVDYEGMKEYNKRIDNGLRLFGKYYRGLWD